MIQGTGFSCYSDQKLRFYLVNYRFLTDFSQASHSFLPTHGWRKSVRNLWFSLCFWFFGGWFKQLGFLVSDLKMRFYLVNYRFLTDFWQASHSVLHTHGWRKSVRNLWFSLCFSIFCGWFKQLGFFVSDLKLRFYLVNYKFLTGFSQISRRLLTAFFLLMANGNLWEICDLAGVFEFLVDDSSNWASLLVT